MCEARVKIHLSCVLRLQNCIVMLLRTSTRSMKVGDVACLSVCHRLISETTERIMIEFGIRLCIKIFIRNLVLFHIGLNIIPTSLKAQVELTDFPESGSSYIKYRSHEDLHVLHEISIS
jgi:hypothetical protein